MLCYAHAAKDIERYGLGIREDIRAKAGDFLLAERDGMALGTSTSLSMTMWVRGTPIPCQGVAYVGTIKTHRRRTDGGDGIATQLMRETVRLAREREQVVSALMPFRGSFYEHFGYGFVERRSEWTLPLAVLPHGAFDGIRFYGAGDLQELAGFHQRIVERGQCEIERPENVWPRFLTVENEAGFVVVDRPRADGPVHGYICFEHSRLESKDCLRVMQIAYEDIPALQRQLHFLASLRDQYLAAIVTLPADLPLNWLLRETQLPHRLVNHAHADVRQDTRMQVRVLDHKRFIESLHLPKEHRGRVVVSVLESEGTESRFEIDVAEGKASVSTSRATPGFTCRDRVWAAIACGDLSTSRAVELGIASSEDARAIDVLEGFGAGPAPFCHEYF